MSKYVLLEVENIFTCRMTAASDRSDSKSGSLLTKCKESDTKLISSIYSLESKDDEKEIKCDPSSLYRYESLDCLKSGYQGN